MEIGQEPKCVFWVRSSCAFLSAGNSSYPLVNTHTEWVHWCRQETIHCSHVFTENMDKLQTTTFTRGCERDVKQASHIVAAGCLPVCVWNCLKLTMCSSLSASVHAHQVQQQIYSQPGQGLTLQTLSKESLWHIMFSSSPWTQTAKDQPQAPPVLQAIVENIQIQSSLWPRHHILPLQQRWGRENLHNHRLTSHLSADFENKQRIHMPKQTRENTNYWEWNQFASSHIWHLQ